MSGKKFILKQDCQINNVTLCKGISIRCIEVSKEHFVGYALIRNIQIRIRFLLCDFDKMLGEV